MRSLKMSTYGRGVSGRLERDRATERTLLRKRMIEVRTNHCELQIESNSIKASCIWFYESSRTVSFDEVGFAR